MSRLTAGQTNVEVGKRIETSGQTVGRWISGTVLASPQQAMALARAYGDSPLNALVALGHITEKEARRRPVAQPDYSQLTNDELLELVRTRMTEGSGGHADRPAAITEPASGPELSVVNDKVDDLIAADEQEQSISGEQESPDTP